MKGYGSLETLNRSAQTEIRRLQQHDMNENGIGGNKHYVRERKMTDAEMNGEASPVNSDQAMLQRMRSREQEQRSKLVLWRHPILVFYYFAMETLILFHDYSLKLFRNRRIVISFLLTFLLLITIYFIQGPHQQYVSILRKEVLWCVYWVGLGILSSVGLGTGLHTFLLYLGPHIASVTIAAYECQTVNFPEPPYPDDIVCPSEKGQGGVSLWTIMSKVRLEAFMWGAGTAIGELPPYFMARAARLSGQIDEEEKELEELIQGKDKREMTFLEKAKVGVHNLVQKVGFIGILTCASIPNPLFDLAGITCGHFLIPFWTFFGATLIGKAVIKMHIQKLTVIFVFSEHHVENVVKLLKHIPVFGKSLQAPFKEWLVKQKAKLHVEPGTANPGENSWLSWVFEKLVMLMVVYFVLSIINSMAQSYHKRICANRKVSSRVIGKTSA